MQASLNAVSVVFAFDPDPMVPANRALSVLTVRNALPKAELGARERFEEAAVRAAADAGMRLKRGQLVLVALEDAPAKSRSIAAVFYAASPFDPGIGPGSWVSAARPMKLTTADATALRDALSKLQHDTRQIDGAVSLLGEIFTADDLLRVHVALHGGPEGSERTFRRRVQELRDLGILRPVRATEVAALRERNERFRSPAGTGGRPPELLRYTGGGEDEQLASLRTRRLH